ncbi:phenylalanine--tRNA ligase subunit beta [Ponticaulis sp.]|uniref:phenylalanine--tRNA ligase subunit beta n=1 Tax=Ponticaulis sp. TaxID=2020902 RepID=UPI000B6E0D87|nr:phenylalanine--tRNA ligase subunit beta [Ponticaulis sp.]MAI91166.1 phenylalanine--tRNA ligase subunit beta [Ponticaulis sp.]OUX98480.1 MAG: phenylalanine--tRNA ligase subunit beta [Hyphomonadaceae bacterium TMED5]|tara:strand:- start:127903 stop:130296 length:2394 start_codon:yes stop_codon:yes gene_type:complete
MKFTVSWLQDHLLTKASMEELLDAMTNAGLEVESVENPAEALSEFTVAHVKSVTKHPDADKLNICEVDTKDGMKTIVCGAPNVSEGMYAVYAPLGTYIPGLDFALDKKPRKIRGIESHGMMCSAKELEVSEENEGIMDLQGKLKVGQPLAEVLELDDPVIDFEVTPNRPDWLGVLGIARDLAAAGLGKFNPMPVKPVAGAYPCPVSVTIEAPDACPTFAGRMIRGVKNGPSPDWMQARLKSVGISPKNMLVDVTNYISLDRARPLHVYDVAKLEGGLTARLGKEGDKFLALDGKEYEPTEDMCVIADESGVVGLGGVMGGASTGVSDETTDVFIESAYFDPLRIARTGRATGILSDARYRNERGIDPESCLEGLELATRLIVEVCGGEVSDVTVAGAPPEKQAPVQFNIEDVKRLTGVEFKTSELRTIIKDLGGDIEDAGEAWYVAPPSWRRDLKQSADMVEEIIRIKGFAALPLTSLPEPEGGVSQVLTEAQRRVRAGRRLMAARGFLETVTWSFVSHAEAKQFGGGAKELVVDNPVASELDCMRPSILPNLIKAAQKNADFSQRNVRLFEAGPVYLGDGPKDQRRYISMIVRPETVRNWIGKEEPYDIYAAKADVFALLEAVGQDPTRLMVMEPVSDHWHPGRSATLRLGPKNVIAEFGELHPRALKALDVDGTMVGFEVNLDAIPVSRGTGTKTKPVLEKLDLTPIRRDFAFVVTDDVAAGDLVKAALGADKALITAVNVFDVYAGKGVEDGHKSIAIEVTIQPKDATLTDAQIDAVSQKIIKAMGKFGGTLRG